VTSPASRRCRAWRASRFGIGFLRERFGARDDAGRLERPTEERGLGTCARGKTHLAIALAVEAARRGYRVAFATAPERVNRLAAAKRASRLDEELERLRRIPLLIVDEVGYIPFDPDAAALFFALISSRYERASLIVTSNKTALAEIFGDPVAVAALVDRLIRHAEVHILQGNSYRLKDRDQQTRPAKTR
jgi:DNA replication protein DnaC